MSERPRATPPKRSGKARDRERAALAELIEVERAIATLEGRNVENAEHLVAFRRDAEQRKAALEKVLAATRAEQARRRRLLPLKIAAAVVGLGVLAVFGVQVTRLTSAQLAERSAAIDAASGAAKRFEPAFTPVRTVVGADAFTFGTGAGTCVIAVAAGTKGGAHLRMERGGATREADGSIGFCSCKGEEVQITASGEGLVATVVVKASADAIGGDDALAAAPIRPALVIPETADRACVETAFDAWLASGKAAPPRPEADKLTADERRLVQSGLALVAFADADAPFVVAPPATDACLLALSRAGGLAVRRKAGDRALATKRGAIGLCAKDVSGLSVWRDGPGEILVFEGPRARLGGLLGLRETAQRAGVPVTVWTPPDDLADDARAALMASGIAVAPGGGSGERPGAIALSTDARSTLTASSAGRDVACLPPLDVGALQTLCLEGRPGAFDASGAMSGAFRAPAPLWLALPKAPDRPALERALELLAFARRMSAEGFELTSLVGATLTPRGADVTGRSGEKEIVAIVVSPDRPFVHTLSVGAPWTLATPQRTLISPGEPLQLIATPRYAGAAKREFVVWRR